MVCKIGVHKQCIAQSGRCGSHSHSISSTSSIDSLINGVDILLKDKLWFVGEMDRNKAQNELERRENGTFLVRIRPQSDDKDKYALTLKYNSLKIIVYEVLFNFFLFRTHNSVKHMKICNTDDQEKKYYLSRSKFFSSIEELVLNYQVNSLKENFER